jgi:hypothetical protein
LWLSMRVVNFLLSAILIITFTLIISAVCVNASDPGPLVITSMDGPDTIKSGGGPYTFSVLVSGGVPPYEYKWWYNDIPAQRYQFIKGQDSISLSSEDILLDNSGGEVSVEVIDSSGLEAWWDDSIRYPGHNSRDFIFWYNYLKTDQDNKLVYNLKKEPTFPYVIAPGPTARPTSTPLPAPTATPVALDESGAHFSSLSGQVELRHDYDIKTWTFAKMNSILYVDDHVKTGEDSSALISFADLTTFLLKSESEIVITTPPTHDSKIRLVIGNIMVNVKKMMKDGTMEIDMSQAVAGIKGTVFVAESNATASTVKGIIHNVTVTSKATGKTVTVGPGEKVTATTAGLGPVSTFNVTEEEANWGVTPEMLTADSTTTDSTANSTGKSGMSALPMIGAGLVICLYLVVRQRKYGRS